MQKKLFEIEITSSGLASDGEKAGFIDNMKAWEYEGFDNTSIDESLIEKFKVKARGYARWREMSYNLSQGGIFYIGNYENDGKFDTAPTKIKFKVGYEQFDGMYIEDELNEGKILTGVEALKRKIANVLVKPFKIDCEYFNTTAGKSNNHPYGYKIDKLQIDAPAKDIKSAEKCIKINELM